MKNILKISFILALLAGITFTSCKNAQEKQFDEIVKIEKSLFGEQSDLNDSIANEFITKADLYIKTYKDDPKNSELLFKTAEVFNGLKHYDFAIRRFQQVFLNYPKSAKAAESIFICGFIYDSNLQKYSEAEFYYRKFIKEFPNHPLAKDAKITLENLGKTPEEMVKEFEKKNDSLSTQ